MFLSSLNEEQKNHFFNLVLFLANTDNVVTEEESEIIETYKKEMNLKDISIIDPDIDTAIEYFSKSDKVIRNIVLLEAATLAFADGNYNDSEKGIIDRMASEFQISEKQKEEIFEVINDLKEVYERIFDVIYED